MRVFPRSFGVLLAACVCAAAHGETRSFRSRNYEIVTDAPPAQAQDVARHMDAVFAEYTRRLSGFDVRNTDPVRFFLWRTNEGYRSFLATKGIDGANTGGLFFVAGQDAGLTTWLEGYNRQRLFHVLQHEGFHQFAHLRLGDDLPIWANEGLAEYFGEGILVRGRLELGLVPAGRLRALQQALREGKCFGFGELLAMTSQQWSHNVTSGDARAAMQYTQSWSMVQFLVHGSDGRYAAAFEQYLRLIARRRDPALAFVDAFGAPDAAPFERAWADYILNLEPDPVSTAVERLEFLGEGLEFLFGEHIAAPTLDDAKRQLRLRKFTLIRTDHGLKRTVSSDDDRLFCAPGGVGDEPPGAKRAFTGARRVPTIALVDSASPDLPSGAAITGLRVEVRLAWRPGDDGRPVSEITFR